jgi:hypothetical protein
VQLAVTERVPSGRIALLIDIGGGSTELTLLRPASAVYSQSLPVGTVRLIEASSRAAARRRRRTGCSSRSTSIAREIADAVRDISIAAEGRSICSSAPAATSRRSPTSARSPKAFPEGRAIDVAGTWRASARRAVQAHRGGARPAYNLRPDRADTDRACGDRARPRRGRLRRTDRGAPGVGLKEGVLVDLARALHAARLRRQRRPRSPTRASASAAATTSTSSTASSWPLRDAPLRRPRGAPPARPRDRILLTRPRCSTTSAISSATRATTSTALPHRAQRSHGPVAAGARARRQRRALPPQEPAEPRARELPRPLPRDRAR